MTPDELKRLRKRLGMTQAQLAEALGVRLETVGRWEVGMRRISEPAARLVQRLVAERRAKKPKK